MSYHYRLSEKLEELDLEIDFVDDTLSNSFILLRVSSEAFTEEETDFPAVEFETQELLFTLHQF